MDCSTYPPGIFQQFQSDVVAAAQTVPGIGKVFGGHYEFITVQNFYQELPHEEFQLFVGDSKGEADCLMTEAEFSMEAELYWTIPNDEPSDLSPINQKMAQLCLAFSSYFTDWRYGGNRNSIKFTWDTMKLRRVAKPFVCSKSIILTMPFIVDQANYPLEVPRVPDN